MPMPTGIQGLTRRGVVAGGASIFATIASGACAQAAADILTPEMFGAKGDGRTNDTQAFQRLSAAVKARGGGTVALRKAVYLVGEQRPVLDPRHGYAFAPAPILTFVGLPGGIAIRGG